MNKENLYKKAYFQCARRAILENETVMLKFAEDVVKNNYSEEKLIRLNELLTKMFDNDMFNLIMGHKKAEDFKDLYDNELCLEIQKYAEKHRVAKKTL